MDTPEGERDKVSQRVKFAPVPSEIADGTHTSSDGIQDPKLSPVHQRRVSPISNLCGMLQRGKDVSKDPIGFITSSEVATKFNLTYRDFQLQAPGTITLRQALLNRKDNHQRFGPCGRYHIAMALSFSVLHLVNTP